VLVATGTLDNFTYSDLRNAIIKAALDEPDAVIVDISGLDVPCKSALSVFTSARRHVSTWPDIPILLVCAPEGLRAALRAGGVTRYVPAYETLDEALASVTETRGTVRRRARAQLPADCTSPAIARTMVSEWLTTWERTSLIPAASTVATILVENVLAYTESAPSLIVEHKGDALTVAVEDESHQPASRHEDAYRGSDIVSGLAIVAALSRAWGSTPTASGKTVWAVVGPENRL
jgi:hypothetical protein